MSTHQRPFPLPSDLNRNSRGARSFTRAVTVGLVANARRKTWGDVAKELYEDDQDVPRVIRAVSSPAITTTTAWGGTLAASAVVDYILGLAGSSAGTSTLARSLQVTFTQGVNTITIPTWSASATAVGFVAQDDPVPVRQIDISGPSLKLKKLMSISVFTREIFEHSTPTIENVVRAKLSEDIALALDSAMFSDVAGDDTTPRGLLYNISPLTASTATSRNDAIGEDLEALGAAVAPVAPLAGNITPIIVASPKQYFAAKMFRRGAQPVFEIFSSAALDDGSLVAIAPNGLASAIDSTPRFDVATQALLHMSTTPGPISSTATLGDINYPARSLFQTDCLALRVLCQLDFALRSSTAVALVENVSW